MVGPDCALSVVLVALGHSTLGRAKVPALVMGCRRGGGKGHTSHSSLHLSLRGHQLTSTRPACSQDQDTRTHHDGHTGEQHSREKLPDPGGMQRGSYSHTLHLDPKGHCARPDTRSGEGSRARPSNNVRPYTYPGHRTIKTRPATHLSPRGSRTANLISLPKTWLICGHRSQRHQGRWPSASTHPPWVHPEPERL